MVTYLYVVSHQGGGGKALRNDQRVLTPSGWIAISKLVVGDKVISPDNKHSTVTGVYPQGVVPLNKVTMADGKSVIACDDHLWEVREAGSKKIQVLTTREIRDFKGRNLLIKHTAPITFKDVGEKPLAPYLVGALIGDGCTVGKRIVSITSADPEVIDKIKSLGYSVAKWESSKYTYGVHKISKQIDALGMRVKSIHKSIPDPYKNGSVYDRLELIRGLMDTDGYVSKDGKLYYYTSSLDLAKDFQYVLRSLGGSATITDKWVKYNGERVLTYSIYIKYVNGKDLVTLTRKKDRARVKTNHKCCAIKSVESTTSGEATCISVDSKDKLFITEDFIVTHNTWAILFDNLKYIGDENYFSVFFRNTTIELLTNLWPEALKIYDKFLKYPENHKTKAGKFKGKAHINYQNHTITFPSGAKSVFSYLSHDKDADSWYGAELSRVYFDEFQRQSEYCFDVIRSRLRSKAKVKSCLRATLNPDDTHFVLDYISHFLDEFGYPIPSLSGKVRYFVMMSGVLYSSWTREELKEKYPDKTAKTYTYIPSTIDDNKILMELEPDYKDSLDSLPETKRKQLLLGCWFNTETGCMYFNREYVSVCDKTSEGATRVRAWDLAGTEYDSSAPAGSWARNPDCTAGVLMSKSKEGSSFNPINKYVVEDVIKERFSPSKVEDLIYKTAEEDRDMYGADVTIFLPTDPNPASARYIKSLISELISRGFRAKTYKSQTAKVERFIPFSVAAENGLVQYNKAEWNKDYFSELENFTGKKKDKHKTKDDQVDATSDAFTMLNSNQMTKPVAIPDMNNPTLLAAHRSRTK